MPNLPSNTHQVVRDSNFQSTAMPTNNPTSIQVLERSGVIGSLGRDLILLADNFLKDLRTSQKAVCRAFIDDVYTYRTNAQAWNASGVQTLLSQPKYADIKALTTQPSQIAKLQDMNKAILWHVTGRVTPSQSEVTFGADAYDRGSLLPSSSSLSSLRGISSPAIPFPMSSSPRLG